MAIVTEESWEIETIPNQKTGCHSAQCPQCPRMVEAQTGPGAIQALCDHMNDWHFKPARGNA